MLLAVIERKLGFGFAGEDIYLNVAGGLSLDEPAVDLASIMAVVSCLKNKAIPPDFALFGEVGLSGEIRSVSQPLARIKEAASLGFQTVVLPKGNLSQLEKDSVSDVELAGVANLKEALGIIF